MLRDEDGMAAVGRLLAVVARKRRCEPLCDQLLGVLAHVLRPAELGKPAVTPT